MSMEDIDEEVGLSYKDSLGNSFRDRASSPVEQTPMMTLRHNNNNNNVNDNVNIVKATYSECLKNHAINQGGHALDGCCEFLPAGPEGSLEALKCAACNCHRNFHRREVPLPPAVTIARPVPATTIPARDGYPPYNQHCHQVAPPPQYTLCHVPNGLLHVTGPPSGGAGPPVLARISPARGSVGGKAQNDAMDPDHGGIGSSSNSKKRFRTKFTPEQKEKMKAFAERLEWKIQKKDDVVVQEFCNENGLERQVLKVWMNNNKHTIGKKF